MKRYKILHFQGMGSFNWFKIAAWGKKNRKRVIRQAEKLVGKITDHGYPENSGVMWLCDGRAEHRNLNRKTPWHCFKKNNKLTFDFETPNEKFWDLYEIWLRIHKKPHLKWVPIYEMRQDYAWYPFANNINGVDGIDSPEALEVKMSYMRKAAEIYIDIFGKFPNIIPWNECDHYGGGAAFHKIMYDHRAVRDKVVIPLGGKYSNMWPDITLCEGAAGELIEPHGDCPKPEACDQGGWHGKQGQHRRKGGLMSIKHGFTTLSDFMVEVSPGVTRLENMIASENDQRMFTEDWHNPVGDGKYLAGPFKLPLGNAQQQYVMMKKLIRVWKETGFLAKFGTFPHEALTKVGNLYVPDYRPRNINWRRLRNGVLKACKEELG